MTIIVYNPILNQIHVDQGITWSNGRKMTFHSKIERIGEHRFAMSGDVTDYESVLDVILKAINGKPQSECRAHKHLNIEGVARHTDGRALLITMRDEVVVATEWQYPDTFATGSGAQYAYAYMAIGMTPLEAATQTAAVHAECGGLIETF